MNRLLRLALTWLLLVAVPLQGYAAGAMLFCGAAGTGSARAAGAVDREDASAPHADDGHHHGAALKADQVESPVSAHDITHGKCSACAACCSAVALPSSPVATTPATAGVPPVAHEQDPDSGRCTARLDRPPRLHLV